MYSGGCSCGAESGKQEAVIKVERCSSSEGVSRSQGGRAQVRCAVCWEEVEICRDKGTDPEPGNANTQGRNTVMKPSKERKRLLTYRDQACIPDGPGIEPVSVDPSPSIVFLQWSGKQTHTSGKALISELRAGESSRNPEVCETPLSRCPSRFASQSSALSSVSTPVAHPSSQIPTTLSMSPLSKANSSPARGWYAQSVATLSPGWISS